MKSFKFKFKPKKLKLNIPFIQKAKTKYRNFKSGLKHPELFSLAMLYLVVPILLNLIITCLELKSPIQGVLFIFKRPYAFLANTLILLMTYSFTLLLRKRRFWVTVVTCIWMIFGIANFVLLCNRVTPFTGNDLVLIDALFDVLQKYFNTFQIILICILAVLGLIALVIIFFRTPKEKFYKLYYSIPAIVIMIGLGIGSVELGTATGLLEAQFAELSAAYRNNGFVYCFTNSLIDTGVSKPKDYSAQSMKQLVENDNATFFDDKADKKPNIIFVQLESLFDIQELNDVEFSDTVLPNINRLQKKGGGLFTVPVIGAGTVNTEFEVLTGMSMDDFGAGEYPFKTILKETTTESLPNNLKPYGYHVHALHNNTGKFYSRDVVYSNLGFEDFTSVEYMENYEKTNMGWAKDYVLTDYIMDCLHADKGPDLVYTISVQGHGGYNVTDSYEKHVEVTNISKEKEPYKDQIEYYANMIWEMDEFVGQLIDALKKNGEDTVLVMYGDHLPSLDIQDSELEGRNTYQTDYIIWNNCGIDFGNKNIEANQVQSYVLGKLGMSNGIINSYHQKHGNDEGFEKGLAALEYDMLYGDQIIYDGKNPYKATNMQFGLYPISVDNVVEDASSENTYIVRGHNFTNYSRVYVNEEIQSTTLIDKNTLSFTTEKPLEATDVINVWQSHLTCTEDYLYNVVNMKLNNEAKDRLGIKEDE
ncbi:MAG: LTA synthase family protein [Lachnospiraceae bacterium]|nr:LTA synthase family protein [Lachnospiraceae bacterium]